jgi:hypothetical protein
LNSGSEGYLQLERRRILSYGDISSFERWTSQPMAATRVLQARRRSLMSRRRETMESGGWFSLHHTQAKQSCVRVWVGLRALLWAQWGAAETTQQSGFTVLKFSGKIGTEVCTN